MGGWIALVTAISQLLAGVAGKVYLSSDARLLRKIERDANLFEKLPPRAKDLMEDLLTWEVGQHGLRRMRRASRKISGSTAAAIIIVAILTALIDWPLAYWAMKYAWGWWIPFGIVTLFGLLLILVGIGQLFVYPDEIGEVGEGQPTDQVDNAGG
ncbi:MULTISPECIES: hypothetical protein [Mycobacterium]|uniref:hypothetical protein n=1 Tax=Mycobacterium TaxID=1763 RepID=UPI00025D5664|nr:MULTISPECIES: hypothetical protein [Mycobacterium]AFJ33953.1 hypothetical protein W7S_04850 [Mycobacterium sp. MOTT36Y]ASW99445.1 hypothetical protein CKJ58_05540 [Mycobacterium intracellulare subsp. chimaera]PBA54204.1 hypothetical protein CKJ57_05370 [Mycobacterium intracellulare subsp. chimaera]PBA62271.1 hypothetical protein CKJ56_04895 [Mycobacterium intracellulare subsp. chimaera]